MYIYIDAKLKDTQFDCRACVRACILTPNGKATRSVVGVLVATVVLVGILHEGFFQVTRAQERSEEGD